MGAFNPSSAWFPRAAWWGPWSSSRNNMLNGQNKIYQITEKINCIARVNKIFTNYYIVICNFINASNKTICRRSLITKKFQSSDTYKQYFKKTSTSIMKYTPCDFYCWLSHSVPNTNVIFFCAYHHKHGKPNFWLKISENKEILFFQASSWTPNFELLIVPLHGPPCAKLRENLN